MARRHVLLLAGGGFVVGTDATLVAGLLQLVCGSSRLPCGRCGRTRPRKRWIASARRECLDLTGMRILRRDRLGGLIHEYRPKPQRAAAVIASRPRAVALRA